MSHSQQLVEIARALATDARILVMDEPTAALTPNEVDKLFVLLHELAARDIGIIFISHRLGRSVRHRRSRDGHARRSDDCHLPKTTDLRRKQLIELMVGRPLESEFPKIAASMR